MRTGWFRILYQASSARNKAFQVVVPPAPPAAEPALAASSFSKTCCVYEMTELGEATACSACKGRAGMFNVQWLWSAPGGAEPLRCTLVLPASCGSYVRRAVLGTDAARAHANERLGACALSGAETASALGVYLSLCLLAAPGNTQGGTRGAADATASALKQRARNYREKGLVRFLLDEWSVSVRGGGPLCRGVF